MMRLLVLLPVTAFCLMVMSSCTPGEAKLTSGAAAGAGIGALLGSGEDSDVPITGEDGLRYYGPL